MKKSCQLILFFCYSAQVVYAQSNDKFALVNTKYEEASPILSPDGRALYFTVANHPGNVGGLKDKGDIWVSIFLEGKWQAPRHAGTLLNNENYNALAGFSADGQRMYVLGHYNSAGTVTTQGISVSTQTSTGWSYPQKITIPYFLNRSSVWSGSISPAENTFVFSMESPGTVGAEDMYVCIKNQGNWSEPIHLGRTLNTPFQEKTPYLSEDGRMLYFSSNGHEGYGSFDVFTSVRKDDSWKEWSKPVNLGQSINSEARELYYQVTKGAVIFTSTRDSNDYADIKTTVDSKFMPTIDTLIKIVENKYDTVNSFQVKIWGNVTDAKNQSAVSATICFTSDSSICIDASKSGAYKTIISSTRDYLIEVKKKGYIPLVEKLDIQTIKLKTLQLNFQLQPIEVGTLVNLNNVLFNMGTTTLLEESYLELNAVVEFLKTNPKVKIELEGHTDNVGDAKKNLQLSKDRVERIKKYLISKGISARRIKGRGFGGSKPISLTDTDEARQLNRRVEFSIIEN